MSLEPGMFVAELDRPRLETPFALQGFVVRDTDEVLYVSKHVEHVYVDAEYKGYPQFLSLALEPTAGDGGNRLKLRKDFEHARVCFESAADTLDRVFDSLRSGHRGDMGAVRDAVNPLIEGVFNNQEAVAALLRLKESGDYRYHHGVSMAVWSAILGRHIGLHRDELEKLAIGCAMCDVGMTQLPGELLGLDAIYPRTNCCSASALAETSVCVLPFSQLAELAQKVPGLQATILRLMSKDLSVSANLATDHTAEERLAGFLLSIAQRTGAGTELRLVMPRRDIASYLRLATETVSRLLARFQQENLLEVHRKQVRIIDLDALRELGGCFELMDRRRQRTGYL